MALTDLQRAVCRVIAENASHRGTSTSFTTRTRRFGCWDADRRLLETPVRRPPAARAAHVVEAEVSRTGESVLVEWMRDSAFRFFPLQRHADLGLTLHPYDLATNKLLALAGRLEVRDWVDLVNCDERIQPLGFLAWGACGKDAEDAEGALRRPAPVPPRSRRRCPPDGQGVAPKGSAAVTSPRLPRRRPRRRNAGRRPR